MSNSSTRTIVEKGRSHSKSVLSNFLLLETFELHDDGEAAESSMDLGDEDHDDVIDQLVLEVNDG